MKILAFSGSLRQKSFNTAALRAAVELAPEGMEIEIYDLNPIPMMNQDLEGENLPEEIKKLRQAFFSCDGVLISTPEYSNYIPGLVKNMLDWGSREYDDGIPVYNKPLAIMGASPGSFGTYRGQLQLQLLSVLLEMRIYTGSKVYIGSAKKKFDENMKLTDERTREKITTHLAGFKDWVEKMNSVLQ